MTFTSNKLRITEIFHSLQGESNTVGLPTVFVRLTGCPLRCQYCDTAYAFNGGELMEIDAVLARVLSFECPYVCVTGGEPLAQPNCFSLFKMLCDAGLSVSLETSGARPITNVDYRVNIVMDLKTPDSGECDKNLLANLNFLKKTDQIKFVLCSQKDYEWACNLLKEYQLPEKAQILFSPSWRELDATMLANWIIRDRLPVRFQIQLHKILWNDAPGH
ncbi:7-carboxy-7-deazaguanine synthase QueE [Legionella gresilensis]|uniref:7-carboxy-7-deazaguanine synthase QueE n=1 Tax=Legionella gresilensis TaxID=91823 RepID=UPI001040F875|nr:7-carboxy-7-deazaguanine synthase QueE [Legionella gresilensis]